ncbi:hypothetical protein SFRURICE_005106 [Spodoptera frugiperda]|nr:hypothetical protein SFRURICE_005106 [Spodoptera frugiperda]
MNIPFASLHKRYKKNTIKAPRLGLPADVQPIPVVEPPSTSTRRGKAMVVTASPHKQEIIDVEKKRKEKDERQQNATGKREAGKKRARNVKKNMTGSNKKKTKKPRKNLSSDEDTSDDEDPILVSTDEEDSDNDDAECPVCHKCFSEDKKGEKWIRCTKCFQWIHEDCAENPGPKFICAICLEN